MTVTGFRPWNLTLPAAVLVTTVAATEGAPVFCAPGSGPGWGWAAAGLWLAAGLSLLADRLDRRA